MGVNIISHMVKHTIMDRQVNDSECLLTKSSLPLRYFIARLNDDVSLQLLASQDLLKCEAPSAIVAISHQFAEI